MIAKRVCGWLPRASRGRVERLWRARGLVVGGPDVAAECLGV